LTPFQEDIALHVALVFQIDVHLEGARVAELIDHDRVVDDQIDRVQRVDLLRIAAKAQGGTDLSGSVVYASGYPCPMCLTAMYLAGVKEVYFAYSNEDGEPHDLSAERGYLEIARPLEQREMPVRSLPVRDEGEDLYEAWSHSMR